MEGVAYRHSLKEQALDVAEQICISEKTVSRHLANIYAKLDVSSRTAAVAWAHANNLL